MESALSVTRGATCFRPFEKNIQRLSRAHFQGISAEPKRLKSGDTPVYGDVHTPRNRVQDSAVYRSPVGAADFHHRWLVGRV
jgi:hypothetical protein